MCIAVIGGIGMAGRHTVEAVRRGGHDAVIISRSRGVDVTSRRGLDEALAGADAVIDVTNVQAGDVEATGEIVLPGPAVRLAPTTFDAWLPAQGQR